MAINVHRATPRERRPSTSEQFGEAFGRLEQGVSGHLFQQAQNESADKQLEELTGMNLRGVDPQTRKLMLESQLKGKEREKEHQNAIELQKQKYDFETKLKSGKNQEKIDENQEIRDIGQRSFDEMVGILKKGDIGIGSGIAAMFGGDIAKQSGKFNSLTGGLESMLVDMVSRGTLSNTRFKYITDTLLPKSTDSLAEIEGKLEGLAEVLKLDSSSLTGKKSSKHNQPLESYRI